MFQFLDDLQAAQVIPSVHCALNLLTHRHRLSDSKYASQLESARLPDHDDTEVLALRVLSEIEIAEEESVARLTDQRVELYIRTLGKIVETVASRAYNPSPQRGEELLESFRKELVIHSESAVDRSKPVRLKKTETGRII